MFQEICKYRVCMHRDVSEDIMENVGLGDVSQRVAASQPSRGRKHSRLEHFKKRISRKKSAYGCGAPASPGLQPPGYLAKIGQTILAQSDDVVALYVFPARVVPHLRKPRPD